MRLSCKFLWVKSWLNCYSINLHYSGRDVKNYAKNGVIGKLGFIFDVAVDFDLDVDFDFKRLWDHVLSPH